MISQSGGVLNNFNPSASQASVAANNFWHNICGQVDDCTQKANFTGSLTETLGKVSKKT